MHLTPLGPAQEGILGSWILVSLLCLVAGSGVLVPIRSSLSYPYLAGFGIPVRFMEFDE